MDNESKPGFGRNITCLAVIILSALSAIGQTGSSHQPTAANRSSKRTVHWAKPGAPSSSEGIVNGQQVQADQSQAAEQRSPQVQEAEHHDVSPPLLAIPPAPRSGGRRVHDNEILPRRFNRGAIDPAIQTSPATALAPVPSSNFDGIGNGVGGFTVNSAPPAPNGDVGPNHYVQIVNTDLAVFNKVGTLVLGPVPTNTLWAGFGGLCQTDNDGDGTVVYDPIADRWVISQFAVSGTTTHYLQCVAVSTSPDPTGSWNRYSFDYGNQFPDYPKIGVWPDAYFTTFNMFNSAGTAFLGGRVCAYDRARMLAGQSATQQCFNPTDAGSPAGGLLPADLDGSTLPPGGSPNYIVALGNNPNQLAYWKFHVDWATPANSTLTGPADLTTAAFSEACAGGTCIPQSGTTQTLDSLADRLMYRLAYRNLGSHEALVVNHSVTAGSGVGVRWYELRPDTNHNLSLFQQGTYAGPDANFRWLGSIAMDQSGNIGLGFSLSGSALHPEIHYTGRLANSPLGVMDQGEGTLIDGLGSQTGSSLSRWGDYSMMAVDPSDDCTFWYTNEYIPTNGAFNWKTRIGSFKFPGCGGVTNDFSISANPASVTVVQGGSGSSTISTAVTIGSPQTISLSASGLPAGAAASFNPASITAGNNSTLALTAGAATPVGNYTITVTGTGTSATHTTSVSLTITSAGGSGIVNGGFETGTLSGWTASGTTTVVNSGAHSGSFAARVGGTAPTSGDSTIAQTFTAPAGDGSLSFWYKVQCPDTLTYDWATATLKDNTSNTTTTVLPKVCTNNGAWVQSSATPIFGSHSYTLTLVSHDDNYPGDPTFTLFDDVVIGAAPPAGITNGGFENGNFTGWTTAGTTAVLNSGAHSGSFVARIGGTSPTNGNSTITQTFVVPSGKSQLAFWYIVQCPDTITYDWATATLRDNTANTTVTVLPRVCTNNGMWVQSTATVTAGHSYTLTLISHDDNYPGDPTFTLFDDVVLN